MKRKKLISLFLFLILSIQVLPLQRIAAWLSSGQLTEEIAHGMGPLKAKQGMDEADPANALQILHDHLFTARVSSLVKHAGAEALIIRHADDILTPPPNSGLYKL